MLLQTDLIHKTKCSTGSPYPENKYVLLLCFDTDLAVCLGKQSVWPGENDWLRHSDLCSSGQRVELKTELQRWLKWLAAAFHRLLQSFCCICLCCCFKANRCKSFVMDTFYFRTLAVDVWAELRFFIFFRKSVWQVLVLLIYSFFNRLHLEKRLKRDWMWWRKTLHLIEWTLETLPETPALTHKPLLSVKTRSNQDAAVWSQAFLGSAERTARLNRFSGFSVSFPSFLHDFLEVCRWFARNRQGDVSHRAARLPQTSVSGTNVHFP